MSCSARFLLTPSPSSPCGGSPAPEICGQSRPKATTAARSFTPCSFSSFSMARSSARPGITPNRSRRRSGARTSQSLWEEQQHDVSASSHLLQPPSVTRHPLDRAALTAVVAATLEDEFGGSVVRAPHEGPVVGDRTPAPNAILSAQPIPPYPTPHSTLTQ